MSESFYARIAAWYDLEFADFDADTPLYLGYADLVGSPILELGCGTGRLLLALAEQGYRVIGVDSSPAMLARAESRLSQGGISPTQASLVLGDMRRLPQLGVDNFRLVILAINAFLHLLTDEDQIAALAQARDVLDYDGLLVIDLFHPTPATLLAMDDRLTIDGSWSLDDGARLDRLTRRRVQLAEQLIETTHLYDLTQSDGQLWRTVASYPMRYVHRFEMERLLASAGFVLEGVYGSYGLDPLEDDSSNMIFVAHRR